MIIYPDGNPIGRAGQLPPKPNGAKQGYTRHPVAPGGDCGFTAFGITRKEALKCLQDALVTENGESFISLLQPAIKEVLITEKFYQYLIKQGALTPETTFETFEENEAHFSKDLAIIQAYLNYDIRDKNVDAGFAHPGVLQALAHIQKVDLRIWHTGENQALQAHRGCRL